MLQLKHLGERCSTFFMGAKGSDGFEEGGNYLILIRELRAQPGGYKNAVLKNPVVQRYLETLKAELAHELAESRKTAVPSIIVSAELVLERVEQIVATYGRDGIEYSRLQKLGYLAANQFEMLEHERDGYEAYRGPSPIITKSEDIDRFLVADKFCFAPSNGRCVSVDFTLAREPAIFLPSFRHYSPEFILWARVRGLAFLRQTTRTETIFSAEYDEVGLYVRKLKDFQTYMPNPAERDFLQLLTTKILHHASDRDLYARILFMAFILDDKEISCRGIESWVDGGRYHGQGNHLERINSHSFFDNFTDRTGEVPMERIQHAVTDFLKKAQPLCPDVKFHEPILD